MAYGSGQMTTPAKAWHDVCYDLCFPAVYTGGIHQDMGWGAGDTGTKVWIRLNWPFAVDTVVEGIHYRAGTWSSASASFALAQLLCTATDPVEGTDVPGTLANSALVTQLFSLKSTDAPPYSSEGSSKAKGTVYTGLVHPKGSSIGNPLASNIIPKTSFVYAYFDTTATALAEFFVSVRVSTRKM